MELKVLLRRGEDRLRILFQEHLQELLGQEMSWAGNGMNMGRDTIAYTGNIDVPSSTMDRLAASRH